MHVTAELLGKGQRKLGGQKCTKRRWEVLDRYATLGTPLTAEQRANFNWFKDEWDRTCREKYQQEWPDRFLCKLQGVLNKLYTDPTAFSKFMFDEERKIFGGTRALMVPRSIVRPLPITDGG